MLHVAVIKHHGHVADRAAIIDTQIGRLHDAILEEVVLDYGTAVECDAAADLHEVEFGEQAGGDKVVTANPASKQPQQPSGKGCSETQADDGGHHGFIGTVDHLVEPDIHRPERADDRLEFSHDELLEARDEQGIHNPQAQADSGRQGEDRGPDDPFPNRGHMRRAIPKP